MLIEVYKDIETCVLRGYMVTQMAFMILGLRDRGENWEHPDRMNSSVNMKCVFIFDFLEKYRNESRDLHLRIMEHNNNLRSSIKEVIQLASRDVFSCSPDNYVFGNCISDCRISNDDH